MDELDQQLQALSPQAQQNQYGDLDEQLAQLTSKKEDQPTTVQPAPQSTFMDGIENFNRQFGRVAENTLKLIPGLSERATEVQQRLDTSAAEAAQRSPNAALAGNILGGVGMAAGGGAGTTLVKGGMLTQMVVNGLVGGLIGNLSSSEGNREMGTGLGFIGGVLSPPAIAIGRAVMGAAPLAEQGSSGYFKKMLNPQAAAKQDLRFNMGASLGSVDKNPLDDIAAAKRVGTNLTPAEVVGDSISANPGKTALQSVEGQLSPSPVARAALNIKDNARSQGLIDKTKGVITNIAPEGDDALTKANTLFREKMKSVEIPTEEIPDGIGGVTKINPTLNKLKQNPQIRDAFESMSRDPDSSFSKLPDTNLSKIDMAKRNIEEKIYRNTTGLKSGEKTSLSASELYDLKEARAQLASAFDDVDIGDGVTYAQARQTSQKQIFRRNINDALKKNNAAGLKDYYKTLMQGDKGEEFLHYVRETGGNVAQAQDLMRVIEDMTKGTINKSISIRGSTEGTSIGNILYKITHPQGYRDAMSELVMDMNKWQPLVQDILEAPKSVRPEVLATALKTIKQTKLGAIKESGKGMFKIGAEGAANLYTGYIPLGIGAYVSEDEGKR